MEILDIEADVENLDRVTDFVNTVLESHDCGMKLLMQISLAVEEAFVNIANYAYSPEKTGRCLVKIEVAGGVMSLCFEDSGTPFNPIDKTDPDITASADERDIGGLGIYMVKKIMDSVDYKYQDAKNILSMTKQLV